MVLTSIKNIGKLIERWWPVLIVVLALVVRLVGNTYTPPSPYWEEAAIGYDAFSVLKTARDHRGQAWPLVAFTSFADYKPSLYFYLTVPSVALLGLNTGAVRLPAAVASSLTVGLVYLLAERWSNRRTARWASLILLVQPWSWQVGRVGFEVNSAVALLLFGIYAFLRSNEPRAHRVWRWLCATSFALSMYAYHAARILAPLFAVSLWLMDFLSSLSSRSTTPLSYVKALIKSVLPWLPSAILAAIIIAPILWAARGPVVQQRFRETSIFSQLTPIATSNQRRALAHYNALSRLVEHRWVWWVLTLWESYASHFDPSYLFSHGDVNPRHSSQFFGMLYPWEIITIGAGVVLVGTLSVRARRQLVVLTLLSPLAAMITVATPHSLRALPLATWLAIWSGLGVGGLVDWAGRWRYGRLAATMGALTIIAASFVVLVYWLSGPYRYAYSREWQYGYQELYTALQHYQQPDEAVYVAKTHGRPAMYLWFYTQANPRLVQKAMHTIPTSQAEPTQYENYYFIDGNNGNRGLHAITSTDLPKNAIPLQQINFLDGTLAWQIYRQP